MHPINRLRLETHVAMVRVKELPVGFRVLLAETVAVESLPEIRSRGARSNILYFQTNHPKNNCCVALFVVEAIDTANSCLFYGVYGLGPISEIVAIQCDASLHNIRQVELIQMLNKEI
jgi:hypothetical protein